MLVKEPFKIIGDIDTYDLEAILERHENKRFSNDSILGFGTNATVYDYQNKYAVKVFNTDDIYIDKDDAKILLKLQDIPCFPKLYAYNDEIMIVEKVNGCTYKTLWNSGITPLPNWEEILSTAFDIIVERGFYPQDLGRENIMFDKSGFPYIIDVGAFMHKGYRKQSYEEIFHLLEAQLF